MFLLHLLKVGHGGTLDPMATGVLVLGVGRGCKAMQDYLKVSVHHIQHQGTYADRSTGP